MDEAVDGSLPVESPQRRRRRHPSSRVRRNRVIAVLILVVGFLAVVVLAPAVWFLYQLDPPGGSGGEVSLMVEEGWGVRTIGDELQDAGVIGSSLAFQVYAGVTGAGPFQAGQYDLRTSLGVRKATGALEDGPDIVFEELLLPPGLRLTEIAERVGELSGRNAQRFLDSAASGVVRSRYQSPEVSSLEGLTYPDTYLVAEHEDEVDILRRLVERFDEVADEVDLTRAADVGLTPYQTVIVASLLQSEAGIVEDGPRIAAVVYNRLGDGMLLQIDATVLYAIGERRLNTTPEERAVDSPYNTYRFPGLPPTPISTVTEATLEAALTPADVTFRYYVLIDEDGRHAFADTLEKHEVNVAVAREKGLLE